MADKSDLRSISTFCRTSAKLANVCALQASSSRAALRLARGLRHDLVVVVRATGPAALRRFPVANRPGRIVVLTPLPTTRRSKLRWLTAAAARSDLDVAVVPRASASAELTAYLTRLKAQLETPDRLAPTRTVSVAISANGRRSLTLAWRHARDNRRVRGYGIYLSGTRVGSTRSLTYSLTGLTCERTYVVGVAAFDATGNRSPIATVSATTGACPPPARATTVVNAPDGTVVRANTFYRDPVGRLRYPDGIKHVTVTGAKEMPDYVKDWQDVWVEGKPGAYMDLGPGVDIDLMQIKRSSPSVPPPSDLTFRYFRMHDLSRTGTKHTDGLQLMAGRNIRFLDGISENVDVQPFFVRDSGSNAGGGPIEDITFQRITVTRGGGYYTFRISGNDEAASGGNVPTRVKIIDCTGDKRVSIDQAAARAGSEAINYRKH